MIVLAMDTCCGTSSVTIQNDYQLLAQVVEKKENKQAELLIPIIESALSTAQMSYADINLLVVTNGPGSFTGIRAGLASIYAISSLLNIPAIGITTLEVLAAQLINDIEEDEFYITVAAGRGRYYCQLFDKSLKSLTAIDLKEERDIIFLKKNLYGDYKRKIIIDTSILANIGLERLRAGLCSNIMPIAQYSKFHLS